MSQPFKALPFKKRPSRLSTEVKDITKSCLFPVGRLGVRGKKGSDGHGHGHGHGIFILATHPEGI
jgi:hypothetical protein